MSVVYIVLGIVVGVLLTVVFPWMLLRNLDREDKGREEKKNEGP
jgi:hydrogenase-4 membrane subunit HyfE